MEKREGEGEDEVYGLRDTYSHSPTEDVGRGVVPGGREGREKRGAERRERGRERRGAERRERGREREREGEEGRTGGREAGRGKRGGREGGREGGKK